VNDVYGTPGDSPLKPYCAIQELFTGDEELNTQHVFERENRIKLFPLTSNISSMTAKIANEVFVSLSSLVDKHVYSDEGSVAFKEEDLGEEEYEENESGKDVCHLARGGFWMEGLGESKKQSLKIVVKCDAQEDIHRVTR